ncbi:uncharacterized protein LOC131229096 isoform X3 [Magnolia sinica]|uniref:uncharacterized protein LOC131229096 isoform X3 n=1 Tax=Magnolia sinica TaxID=86752 RepID=UPI00265B2758|nr:uncharacterized protein LOC131229096 isoform X3 [Magnolia sinica]
MGGNSSSSGAEDGDADWRAAIDSVTADFNLTTPNISGSIKTAEDNPRKEKNSESRTFKLFQIKAQKLLDDLVDKNLVMVKDPTPALDGSPERSEGGIRLFSQAPPGIIFDPVDAYPRPTKRPRILPGEEVDEKSKKFRRRVESVSVDGIAIMAAAKAACQRSLARFEAKDAAAKAAAKKEEERVTELKRLRGEEWLPSIAREMQAHGVVCGIQTAHQGTMLKDP